MKNPVTMTCRTLEFRFLDTPEFFEKYCIDMEYDMETIDLESETDLNEFIVISKQKDCRNMWAFTDKVWLEDYLIHRTEISIVEHYFKKVGHKVYQEFEPEISISGWDLNVIPF